MRFSLLDRGGIRARVCILFGGILRMSWYRRIGCRVVVWGWVWCGDWLGWVVLLRVCVLGG